MVNEYNNSRKVVVVTWHFLFDSVKWTAKRKDGLKKMKKPVLVIMAAGMGSRYGGLKQIDPIDDQGHIIMDFSLYDAALAGFEKAVFIIKEENEEDFRAVIGDRMSRHMEIAYVYQNIHTMPDGFSVPEGRSKPWGTGHAVLSCMDAIDGPFAVINADDYYGRDAFQKIYDYLTAGEDGEKYRYAMVGYILENTLTENGYVARGVCQTNESGYLQGIIERTRIEKKEDGSYYTEDDGRTWNLLEQGCTVSMNMWGFTASILQELKDRFPRFLKTGLAANPMKCEYFLPNVVGEMIREGKAEVAVLKSTDRWYGVTYKEDKPMVMAAIKGLKDQGLYPNKLWED